MDLNSFCTRQQQAAGSSGDAPHTGTTIVACSYAGGVVVGADSRVSTGNYVSNRASNKITQLLDNVYLLRSGSAADTQAIGDYVRYFAAQLAAEAEAAVTVKTVGTLLATMNYQNKHLVGAMIVAGYDEHEGGQVYGCPIGGTLVREAWAIDGSGSTYIWGYCDSEYRDDMTQAEAEAFVKEALALAMARDSSSGGVIRLVTINKDGAKSQSFLGNDVPQFFEDLPQPSAMVVG